MGVILLNKSQEVVNYIRSDSYTKAQKIKQLLDDQAHTLEDWGTYVDTIGVINKQGIQDLMYNGFFSELNGLPNYYIKKWLHIFNIYDLMQDRNIIQYTNIVKVINQHARVLAGKAATKQYALKYPKITINGREEIVLPMFDYLINYAYNAVRFGYECIDDEVIFDDHFYHMYDEQIAASPYEVHHGLLLQTLKSLEIVYQRYYKHSLNIRGVHQRLGKEIEQRLSNTN